MFKIGHTIVYNDGREGHREVRATVIQVNQTSMTVQFEDRADTTVIRFADAEWMNYIRKA